MNVNETPAAGRIYKVLTAAQWAALEELGLTLGSPDDRRDGFIHFSTARQLSGTLAKYFGTLGLVWLAEADADGFGAALKWEPSRSGVHFPHLYAPLMRSAILRIWTLRRGTDEGNDAWILPAEIAA